MFEIGQKVEIVANRAGHGWLTGTLVVITDVGTEVCRAADSRGKAYSVYVDDIMPLVVNFPEECCGVPMEDVLDNTLTGIHPKFECLNCGDIYLTNGRKLTNTVIVQPMPEQPQPVVVPRTVAGPASYVRLSPAWISNPCVESMPQPPSSYISWDEIYAAANIPVGQ